MPTVKRFNIWHGIFFLMGAVVAGLFAVLMPSNGLSSFSGKSIHSSLRSSASQTPWGEVEYTTVDLERPDESFADVPPVPQPIEWYFDNLAPAQIEDLLKATDLTAEEKKVLLDKTRWRSVTNGWLILPPLELVRDMSSPVRKKIYAILHGSPRNLYIQNPVLIDAEKFDGWLASCGLPDDKQELIRRLAISEGNLVRFYDSALMELICTPAERKSLGKAVTRTSALLMKLHVGRTSDLDALIGYWARGSRGLAMKPLLESLARVPGGTSISVSFFLPAFARMRLYTYPDSRNDKLAYHQDCFWTAMNFFNDQPDYRFFNADQIQATLKSEYTEVNKDWAFGDVIMLVDSDKKAIHMCVYIADDVVFTKNGATFLAPWVLMKMPDMLKPYTAGKPIQTLRFRKKAA